MTTHKLLTLSAVGALLIVAFVLYGQLFSPFTAMPELTQNLPPEADKANAAFNDRVHTRFPETMPVADIMEALKAEGFELGNSPELPGMVFANFTVRKFPCRLLWSVQLKITGEVASDKVGHYRAQCL